MNSKPLKRWKMKQKKFNQKYKLKSFKKSAQVSDLSGKCLFLVSAKNLCTILKFVTNKALVTETALIVDSSFIKQLSNRVLITSKRNKKVLEKCEVMITKNYKDSIMRLINITQPSQLATGTATTAPIKKVSCKICKRKFKNKKNLQHHITKLHKEEETESDNETESDQETDIPMTEQEIDEMINDPEFVPIHPNIMINEMSLDSSTNDAGDLNCSSSTSFPTQSHHQTISFLREEDKSEYKCRICSFSVTSRGFLNRHMLGLHILNVFKCYKCKVSFEYKLKLLKHLRNFHTQHVDDEGFKATICDPDSVSIYQCCFCKFSSLTREAVVEHMLGDHYDEFEMEGSGERSKTSSPDSLEELLLPENRAQLLGFTPIQSPYSSPSVSPSFNQTFTPQSRRPPNDSSFLFRCARCKRQFARKGSLKSHVCPQRTNLAKDDEDFEPPPAKIRRNVVNGFYHCPYPRCSQVYTNKVLFDVHLAIDHEKN